MSTPIVGEPALTTRRLEAGDIDAVHRIEVAVSPDPWSAELFADELVGGRNDRHWLVATVAGRPGSDPELVGFGGLLFVADEAHVMNLAIAPAHQRNGFAARLLARLLLTAGDRGSIAATLEVRRTNRAAIGLYRRVGFVDAGMRPRYYPDGEDAMIMWAHRIDRNDYRDRLLRFGEADGRRSR